jgi:tripartite-type tricarboxylate transporter receptor subunit TctC
VWAPAATPYAIVDRLANDIASALAQPNVHEWLVDHGMEPLRMTPDVFARFVLAEKQRAMRILGASGSAHTQ